MIRRPHVPGTRYLYVYSNQQFAAGTSIVLLYEKVDAAGIEPRPLSPNTCRPCARSSRTLFRPQASGDGARMQGVLVKSRASCPLSTSINSRAGSNSGSQQQQYEGIVDNSRRCTTASSFPDAVPRVPG